MGSPLMGAARATNKLFAELHRQDSVYGYRPETDRDKTAGDFLTYIRKYLRRAEDQYSAHDPAEVAQTDVTITKIGALCAAYLASRRA